MKMRCNDCKFLDGDNCTYAGDYTFKPIKKNVCIYGEPLYDWVSFPEGTVCAVTVNNVAVIFDVYVSQASVDRVPGSGLLRYHPDYDPEKREWRTKDTSNLQDFRHVPTYEEIAAREEKEDGPTVKLSDVIEVRVDMTLWNPATGQKIERKWPDDYEFVAMWLIKHQGEEQWSPHPGDGFELIPDDFVWQGPAPAHPAWGNLGVVILDEIYFRRKPKPRYEFHTTLGEPKCISEDQQHRALVLSTWPADE
jgi:hypothetical protein